MVSLCNSLPHYSIHLTPGITAGSARSTGDTAYADFHTQCRLGVEVSYCDKNLGYVGRLYAQKIESLFLQRYWPSSSYPHPVILRVSCEGAQDLQSSSELASEQPELRHEPRQNACHEPFQERGSNLNFSAQEETGGADGNGHGNGKFGTGGDGDDDSERDDASKEDEEFGRLLDSEEVDRLVQTRNVVLPSDMAEVAKTIGIRSLVLTNFMDLQSAKWPLGAAIRGSTMFRNRMLADQSFLFKILTEIAIDSGCATVAEVQKRGEDFWNEFELYMADLVVGVVVDVALVSMLAPFIQFQRVAPATGLMAKLLQATQSLPSSVFEAATPGRRFTVQQRIASYFYKGIQYGGVGFGCGMVGQGIANSLMCLKRKMKKSDSHVPVPPLVKSAALWGVFLAVSSNTRYQVVNGLERVVEGSAVARRLPLLAMAFTVCIRFANNTYGGMQFVDWARWSGVQ